MRPSVCVTSSLGGEEPVGGQNVRGAMQGNVRWEGTRWVRAAPGHTAGRRGSRPCITFHGGRLRPRPKADRRRPLAACGCRRPVTKNVSRLGRGYLVEQECYVVRFVRALVCKCVASAGAEGREMRQGWDGPSWPPSQPPSQPLVSHLINHRKCIGKTGRPARFN